MCDKREASLQFAKAFGVEAWEPKDKESFLPSPQLNKATRFLKDPCKLEKMKRLLRTPGSVIKLRGGLNWSDWRCGGRFVFYNRSSYINLHQIKLQIEATHKARGQPSRFHVFSSPRLNPYAYLIAEMLHTMVEKHDDPDFKMIWISDDCRPYGYTPSTGWYEFIRTELALRLMRKYSSSTDCFVYDRDLGVVNCNTVLASDSQVPFFENFVKYRCERRVLPAWTPQEVADRRSKIRRAENGYGTIKRKPLKSATTVSDRRARGTMVVKARPPSDKQKVTNRRCIDPSEATIETFRETEWCETLLDARKEYNFDECGLTEDDYELHLYYSSRVFDFSINPFTFKRYSDPNFEIAAASTRFLADMSFDRDCAQHLRRSVATSHPFSRVREVHFAKLCHLSLCNRFSWREGDSDSDSDSDSDKDMFWEEKCYNRYLCRGRGRDRDCHSEGDSRGGSKSDRDSETDSDRDSGDEEETKDFRFLLRDLAGCGTPFASKSGPAPNECNAKVRRLLMPRRCLLHSLSHHRETWDCDSGRSRYVFLDEVDKLSFPGVDAVFAYPLWFFSFCASGTYISDSENTLVNTLYKLLQRFNVSSSERSRELHRKAPVLLFFIVPEENILDFRLINEPALSASLTEPGCSCTSWSSSSEAAKDIGEPTLEPSSETDATSLNDSHVDERCWWCRCLQYLDARVLGLNLEYSPRSRAELKKKFSNFDDQIYQLDWKIVPWAGY